MRYLLIPRLDPAKFSFEGLRLRAKQLADAPYSYGSEDAEVYFQIVNVQGDTGVLLWASRNSDGSITRNRTRNRTLQESSTFLSNQVRHKQMTRITQIKSRFDNFLKVVKSVLPSDADDTDDAD